MRGDCIHISPPFFLLEMASPEDVGARRQTFYEIECVIEDCDSEVGYKPLSDSDELDDSAEEEEPREEE